MEKSKIIQRQICELTKPESRRTLLENASRNALRTPADELDFSLYMMEEDCGRRSETRARMAVRM